MIWQLRLNSIGHYRIDFHATFFFKWWVEMIKQAITDIEIEIKIVEHNLWVAKTIVEDKTKELNKLKNELKGLQSYPSESMK